MNTIKRQNRKYIVASFGVFLLLLVCYIGMRLVDRNRQPTESASVNDKKDNPNELQNYKSAAIHQEDLNIHRKTSSTYQASASANVALVQSGANKTLGIPSATDVYTSALKSTDPDERAIGVRYAMTCTQSKVWDIEDKSTTPTLLDPRSQARAFLLKICEGSDELNFRAELQKTNDRAGKVFSMLSRFDPKNSSQEQSQAELVALSSPQKYSWQIAFWLDNAIATNFTILGSSTSGIISRRIAALNILEGLNVSKEVILFENLRACAEVNLCAEARKDFAASNPSIADFSNQMISAINRQDWNKVNSLVRPIGK